jgi:hypothetical protein
VIPFSRVAKKVMAERLGVTLIDVQSSEELEQFQQDLMTALRLDASRASAVSEIADTVEAHDLQSLAGLLNLIGVAVNIKVRWSWRLWNCVLTTTPSARSQGTPFD